MNAEELIDFEQKIADEFNHGSIRAPVHLSGGNEEWLINYFQQNHDPARGDWVATTWRSHYHCLLAGVPPADVLAAILAGRSITLTFPEHRVISSAIVGGVLPIALGIAMGIRRQGSSARCHVFLGDMTAMTGAFHEAAIYARRQDLPVTWIVEDNGLSVLTDTQDAWGRYPGAGDVRRYTYRNSFPHAGAGRRVEF